MIFLIVWFKSNGQIKLYPHGLTFLKAGLFVNDLIDFGWNRVLIDSGFGMKCKFGQEQKEKQERPRYQRLVNSIYVYYFHWAQFCYCPKYNRFFRNENIVFEGFEKIFPKPSNILLLLQHLLAVLLTTLSNPQQVFTFGFFAQVDLTIVSTVKLGE